MSLNYDELIQFDLLNKIDSKIKEDPDYIYECFDIIQEINSIDQFIRESPSFPGSTEKIIRNELLSAIGATLAIEGTSLKKEEIEESFRKASLNEKLKRSEQEAENSRKVYEFVIELAGSQKENFVYEEMMIKQIHKLFTNDISYQSNKPGDYRGDFNVTFGTPRKEGLCKTRFEVEMAMSRLVNWLNREEKGFLTSNVIAKAILAHYYLTEIHPFSDGNGRTARALEALVLYVSGLNNYCFWSLANFWSTHRTEYLVHLGEIREKSDASKLLLWGLRGFLEEIERIKALVLKKVKQLMLMDYTKYLLANKSEQKIKLNQRIVRVMDLLIHNGRVRRSKFLSRPEMLALYSGYQQMTQRRDIAKMHEIGIIILLKEDDGVYIEANYKILDLIVYNV